MCQDCGCDKPARPGHGRKGKFVHTHDGHTHTHAHGDAAHAAHDAAPAAAPRRIVVEQSVLARNDALAARNRQWLDEHGVVAVNLISSPGAGKTALLEKTLDRLAGEVKCAVITGDQQTDNDARRLRGRGAAVMQIQTRSACHLNAGQIAKALPRVVKPGTRLLFIENVGNLVCPAAFDLGEHFKIALLSTAEGEDKPLKYPTLFANAPVVVLTKMDLAPHLDWDAAACRRSLRQIHPGVFIIELSARSGDGMDTWIDYLRKLVS